MAEERRNKQLNPMNFGFECERRVLLSCSVINNHRFRCVKIDQTISQHVHHHYTRSRTIYMFLSHFPDALLRRSIPQDVYSAITTFTFHITIHFSIPHVSPYSLLPSFCRVSPPSLSASSRSRRSESFVRGGRRNQRRRHKETTQRERGKTNQPTHTLTRSEHTQRQTQGNTNVLVCRVDTS